MGCVKELLFWKIDWIYTKLLLAMLLSVNTSYPFRTNTLNKNIIFTYLFVMIHTDYSFFSSYSTASSIKFLFNFHTFILQSQNSEAASESEVYIPVVWMCLFCGHQGCDRNSKHQHALAHYKKPRSDKHCLILSTYTWTVWWVTLMGIVVI